MPAATPAKRARQRANRAARKAEDATNTDATATATETLPVDDSLNDNTNHLTPESSNIPAFISPDNVEHVAIWKAAIAEAYSRGLEAGIELAEKQMIEKFAQLEDRERRNRRIAFSAEGLGREAGVNEERARWLAIYPDTVFSEFDEDTFPETVPLAPAAKPPPPITHDVASQATLPVPQMQLVLLPPSSPPTNEMSTQTDDSPVVTAHSVLPKTAALMPISSIMSPLPSPVSTQNPESTPAICRWSDESDDPYITAETIQHAPNQRARDVSVLRSGDNPWKSLQYRRRRDRRRGQRFTPRPRPHFDTFRPTRHPCSRYPFFDTFYPPCPCVQFCHPPVPPWMTRS